MSIRFSSTWHLALALILALLASSCSPSRLPTPVSLPPTAIPPASATPLPSSTPTVTASPLPTATASLTPVPPVKSLKATVTADLLSCRYGPGPNYLFLYGLRKGANIVLVGRTDGANWRWVWVQGKSPCWVKTDFLSIQGNWLGLPVVYPGIARLPVSPYYPPTVILHATRSGDQVTVQWADIPLRAGDEEDQFMQHYIVEVWRCQDGQLLFEPLATNDLSVTFIDQPGCTSPSHGRVFVQEKHGLAGPAEIPWPSY